MVKFTCGYHHLQNEIFFSCYELFLKCMTNMKWQILKVNIPFQVKHHFINYAKAKASSFFHFQVFFTLISSITALKWIFIIRHFKFFLSIRQCYAVLRFLSLFHLNLLAINLNVFVCNANIHMRNICEQD